MTGQLNPDSNLYKNPFFFLNAKLTFVERIEIKSTKNLLLNMGLCFNMFAIGANFRNRCRKQGTLLNSNLNQAKKLI